jgi:PAS domain S-box-containing protein
LRMSGYSETDIIGRHYLDLVVPEYRRAAERFYGLQLVKKTPNTYYELPLLSKEGNTLWVGQNVQLLKEEGEIVGFQAIARDITARKRVEEELSLSNKEWQDTFAAVSDLVMVLDDKHRIVRANKAMVDALGLTEKEMIGEACHQVVHGEKVPPSFCPHTRLLADGKNHFADVHEPRLGGAFDIRVSPLLDEHRQVRGSVHVARDMRERHQLERSILFEKERFQTLSECSPLGMILIGPEGVFEYVNPKFQEMFGYDLKDVRNGREFFRKAYPDASYRRKVISAWITDDESAEPGQMRPRTFKARCKDDIDKIILFRSVRLETGGYLVTCEDVTAQKIAEEELKKAEQTLRQSEEKYRVLVEESFDGVFVQKQTKIVFTNSRLREMLGYAEGELEGQYHWLVYHPEYQEITRERAKARLKGEPVPSRYEVRMQRKDGSSFEASLDQRYLGGEACRNCSSRK